MNSLLNIRLAEIQAVYAKWSERGAQFPGTPKKHATEMRRYIRELTAT